jgi:hypothetical protein
MKKNKIKSRVTKPTVWNALNQNKKNENSSLKSVQNRSQHKARLNTRWKVMFMGIPDPKQSHFLQYLTKKWKILKVMPCDITLNLWISVQTL